MNGTPRVFSIPPGVPFLATLVDALLEGRLIEGLDGDSEDFTKTTIYVPTRRAAQSLATILALRFDGRTKLLPQVTPLGDAGSDAFGLAEDADESTFAKNGDDFPAINHLERRLILTQLVQSWSRKVNEERAIVGNDIPFAVPASPADAVVLAGHLEELMDSLTTQGVPFEKLADAVEGDYSRYFEFTHTFAQIAAENWPRILEERKASDPAKLRTMALMRETGRLLREAPSAPVIAAGSTGSIPATAAFLAAIANLPRGALVLPGLDTHLDEESWQAIGDETGEVVYAHPQAMLRRLLHSSLRLKRQDVALLGQPGKTAAAREALISEALRPAETTDRWALLPTTERLRLVEEGSVKLALVEVADEREEALAIAIALRETLADKDRTVALVTPDRQLAHRVVAELGRWNIEVEDSAGIPLSETSAGRLARLSADAVAARFHPVKLLALLAHPLVRLGWPRVKVEDAASALEIGTLRGPIPKKGLSGLREALALRRKGISRYTPAPKKRLTEADDLLVAQLIDRLELAFQDFPQSEEEIDLVGLAQPHLAAFEALTSLPEGEEGAGVDQESLKLFLEEMKSAQGGRVRGKLVDYPAFFACLAQQHILYQNPHATHRRVKILGLLEARLLSMDRVVLGGLDEGVWPPRAEADAFLNRAMRNRIGLTPPERRIGQSAHDFAQLLGCDDVVMTRSSKRDGSPTVPSRFLQRLRALSGEGAWREMVKAGERYRHLVAILDQTAPASPIRRPAPQPTADLIPRTLSVTEVETLIRDPYAIFARHILRLDKLEALARLPSAADRGTIIHAVLGRFAQEHPHALPDDAKERLLSLGEEAFAPIAKAYPEIFAVWWPRFERAVQAFLYWERERRESLSGVLAEISGAVQLPLKDGTIFTLRARADRIEIRRDGGNCIIDFKTGELPGLREIFAGFSPQLTLEAAMLLKGAFKGIPPSRTAPELLYVQLSGGRAGIKERSISAPKRDARSVEDIISEHWMRFQTRIEEYCSGQAPFVSRPFAKFAKRFSDYDHLARVKEWSLADEGDENGAEV